MTSESPRIPILFASGNKHKTNEIQALLGEGFIITDLSSRPSSCSPEEIGDSFEANALIKAEAALSNSHIPVLADDSGLEVDALGGAPGIHTARFAGPTATDEQNRAKLLDALHGQTNRSARFVCVLALIAPSKPPQMFRGEIRGVISSAESGLGGFGYDPLFIPEGFSESFAALPSQVKNRISHRALAVQRLLQATIL